MKRLHINKMDTWLRNMSPWRNKGGRVGKQRQLGVDEANTVEKAEWQSWVWILRRLKMDGSAWREAHRLKRFDMTISIIMKDWYSHWSMRTPLRKRHGINIWLEATRIPQLKTKQRIGLQNKPEQTYDRDFVRSFRGGAYTGSILQHHHVQGSAHNIRSVPESA